MVSFRVYKVLAQQKMDQWLGRAWVSMALTAKVPRRIKGLMEVLQVSTVVAVA